MRFEQISLIVRVVHPRGAEYHVITEYPLLD